MEQALRCMTGYALRWRSYVLLDVEHFYSDAGLLALAVVSLSMNLADRFFRVVKANINSIIQNLEDPEKVLEQAVDDMQNDLIKIRQSYAEVSATQKRYELT